MRKDRMEIEELKVPDTAKPTSEVRALWAWVEPFVWTDRMLWALEKEFSESKEWQTNAYFAKLGLFSLHTA